MNRQLPFVVLDNAESGHEHVTLFSAPRGIVVARNPNEVGIAFTAIEDALRQGFHVAGYFSYELGYVFEPRLAPLLPENRAVPFLWFGLFEGREDLSGANITSVLENQVSGRTYAGPPHFNMTEASYAQAFECVQQYILAGDIYQANLTFQGRFSFVGDPLALYLRLRANSAAGHGAFVNDGERSILSLSPEMFFQIEASAIRAKPMKGTAPRGSDFARDIRMREELKKSEKDRAENLMIVDLVRNDLGRIAATGSVCVDELFAIETYPTLHQMVSIVSGRLKAGTTPVEIAAALFPCGSVTGAPKIRAMQVIAELEESQRGIYCGAIGAFSPDGDARFNVAIRTITIAGNEGALGVGSGIVADSECGAEYSECLLKSHYVSHGRRPLSLIETLRYEPGDGFAFLDGHIARMKNSAAVFGVEFDENAVMQVLQNSVRAVNGAQRVRLELFEDGSLACSAEPLELECQRWNFAVSERPVQSTDQLLRHKTSWREHFETELARLSRLTGCDEVIFVNERGEITEGSHSNVFLLFGEELVTPSLACGLLNGCLRRALLDDPRQQCKEAVLFPKDLARADAVYLGNSVRKLIAATPVAAIRDVA